MQEGHTSNSIGRDSTHDPELLLRKKLSQYPQEVESRMEPYVTIMNKGLKIVTKFDNETQKIIIELKGIDEAKRRIARDAPIRNSKTSEEEQKLIEKRKNLENRANQISKDKKRIIKLASLLTTFSKFPSESRKDAKVANIKAALRNALAFFVSLVIAFIVALLIKPLVARWLEAILAASSENWVQFTPIAVIICIFLIKRFVFNKYIRALNRDALWEIIEELDKKLEDKHREIQETADYVKKIIDRS